MRLRENKSIVGHSKILEFLQNCLKNGQIAQAYLFLGPENLGKSTVARWFLSNTLTGVTPDTIESHPDFSLVQREENQKTNKLKNSISIEQIRALRERLSMSSFGGGHKAALIEEADTMSTEASNALLKTLEEPTAKTTIILTASKEAWLPETIKSRCQVLRFALVPANEIEQALQEAGTDSLMIKKVVPLAYGRPGVALDYLDNPELLKEYEQEAKLFESTLISPPAVRLSLAEKIVKKEKANKEEVLKKFDHWERILHQKLINTIGTEQSQRLASSLHTLHSSRQAIFTNTNLQLSLENFLLNL